MNCVTRRKSAKKNCGKNYAITTGELNCNLFEINARVVAFILLNSDDLLLINGRGGQKQSLLRILEQRIKFWIRTSRFRSEDNPQSFYFFSQPELNFCQILLKRRFLSTVRRQHLSQLGFPCSFKFQLHLLFLFISGDSSRDIPPLPQLSPRSLFFT